MWAGSHRVFVHDRLPAQQLRIALPAAAQPLSGGTRPDPLAQAAEFHSSGPRLQASFTKLKRRRLCSL